MRTILVILVCVWSASACSSSGGEEGAQTTADASWAVVFTEPRLELGSDPADADQRFDRIAGLVRFGDGRIVVADRSRELRFFDADGRLLEVAGGRGSGPGEFEALMWMKPYRGDSLLVWDLSHARATVLDGEGGFGRTVRIDADRRFGPLIVLDGAFADGSFLAMGGPPREEERESGRWAVLRLLNLSVDGRVRRVVREVPLHVCAAGEANCAAQYKEFRAVWAADGERLYYARPDEWEIVVFDLNGEEAGRIDGPPRDARPSQVPDRTRGVPAYSRIIVDPGGTLWAKAGEPEETWFVFDSTGGYAGRVEMPEGLEVYQVGRDFVLGVERDELDVERVKLYGLQPAEQGDGGSGTSPGRMTTTRERRCAATDPCPLVARIPADTRSPGALWE